MPNALSFIICRDDYWNFRGGCFHLRVLCDNAIWDNSGVNPNGISSLMVSSKSRHDAIFVDFLYHIALQSKFSTNSYLALSNEPDPMPFPSQNRTLLRKDSGHPLHPVLHLPSASSRRDTPLDMHEEARHGVRVISKCPINEFRVSIYPSLIILSSHYFFFDNSSGPILRVIVCRAPCFVVYDIIYPGTVVPPYGSGWNLYYLSGEKRKHDSKIS